MGKRTLITIIILSFILIAAGTVTANKNGLRAAQGEVRQIGGKAAQIVVDDASQAVLILINGQEKVRIDAAGMYVFDGAYYHGPSLDAKANAQGGSHEE